MECNWRKIYERRLARVESAVNGKQATDSDRFSDLVEQLAELQKENAEIRERLDRASEAFKVMRGDINSLKGRKEA